MSAKEGFQTKHRGFGQTAPVIAAVLFPDLATALRDPLQDFGARMRLTVGQRRPGDGPGTGWNQGGRLTIQQRLVTGVGIVGTVRRHGGERFLGGQLLQQVRQHPGIPHERRGQFGGDHFMVFRIHCQVEFAPGPAPARPVLAHLPFAFAVDLQTGGIDHHMAGL